MGTQEYCVKKGTIHYPQRLLQIHNPPKCLYVRGRLPDEKKPAVAIVGARKCSSYGKEMAQWFAGELAGAGVQIISGMARGVDGIAQRAALAASGESFGVLGCGTDVCYPKENKDLYELLQKQGGILSEYVNGTQPLPGLFPARNRIISALADIVLIIEAKEQSGTLITADYALEQGKDVYVLPGRLTDALSMGCNRLIAQGAGLAWEPAVLLEALGIRCERDKRNDGYGNWPAKNTKTISLSGVQAVLWEAIGEREASLQELYEKISKTETAELWEITDILMEMLMEDIIVQAPGNKYRRKSGILVHITEK